MTLKAAQYARQLKALLPSGPAWQGVRDSGSTGEKVLLAIAEELARIDARGGDVVDEMDPRTAVETLEDWETALGLPNPCVTQTQTTEQRRAAVVSKLAQLGGASRAYFIQVAAALGYTITIEEFRPFLAGFANAGDSLTNDTEWRYTWQVNAPETTVSTFKVGIGKVGEPLRSWGNEELECVIEQLKPAHTHVLFAYGETT